MEAARILRRHRRTVIRWVRAGKLPGVYDETTGLTLVFAEQLRERLRMGEAENRESPARVIVSRAARASGVDALSEEEWRVRFSA